MSKRSDQISQNSQDETSELAGKRKKLSVIKVKDESTGTVVSVGQQTERKKIRKQSIHRGEIKSNNQQGFVSSLNINNKSSGDATKEERNLKAKDITCDICKKFISTNISSSQNDVIDNENCCCCSHTQTSTLTQKLIGFQSEINTRCSERRQENSNSKFQTEETIEKREVGKQFYRGKAFAKSISGETIENHDDDVTTTTTMINLHFNKKFYTPTFGKSDPNCLEKLISNKNNSTDKSQKSNVKKPQGKIIPCSQECNRENSDKTIDNDNSYRNISIQNSCIENNIQNRDKNNAQRNGNNIKNSRNNIQNSRNNIQNRDRSLKNAGN